LANAGPAIVHCHIAAVELEIAAEHGAMLMIARHPRPAEPAAKWLAAKSVMDALDPHG
jgi:hypothetical protein